MAKAKFIDSDEYSCFDCRHFESGYCNKHDLPFTMIPGSGICEKFSRPLKERISDFFD